jgi:hypothetical protein
MISRRLPLLATLLVAVAGFFPSVRAVDAGGGAVLAASADSPSSMPVLLGLEPVRRDLKVSSLQEALLDSLRAEYKAKVGVTAAAGLTDPKIAAKCEADLKASRISYNHRVLRILNEGQRERLRQIERQILKGYFLNSPSEQKLLGFTPEQSKKASDIARYDRQQASAIMKDFHDGKISPFKKDIRLHRLQTTTARSMLHLLTPSQESLYLGLSGPKLKL